MDSMKASIRSTTRQRRGGQTRLALGWLLSTSILLGACATAPSRGGIDPPSASELGVSRERLERLHSVMQGYVDRGEIAGAVTLLARDGKIVDFGAYGAQDRDRRAPMRTNSIFRIASMSKAITSVGVMILHEEGRLLLTDPLSKHLPSFRHMQVVPSAPGEEGQTPQPVPAAREITIADLLTHRSGITYGFMDAGPVGDAYRKAGVSDGLSWTEGTLAENVEKLSKMPLASQPGAEFRYGLSADVLGRVIEVVSGQSLDVFFQERIFRPLQMKDTGFAVPDDEWHRMTTAYAYVEGAGIRPMKDPEAFGLLVFSPEAYYRTPKRYFSGGAGLVSTAGDYGRFLQMLLNRGELDGVRLLSPKTVEIMTISHTSDLPRDATGEGQGIDFGLGFAIVTDLAASKILGSRGRYAWGSIYGSSFWVDPAERLVAVLLVQRYPNVDITLREQFQVLVYQSLVR
ncbi:serine hydrolase domain-containing protein [Sorangium sp. So ce321]|uniref:serine hydrolase domain-containing protein n=1 Tax=Sorangium sp. So ce321 TaxID=3133300 RepID=UPI003F5F5FF5